MPRSQHNLEINNKMIPVTQLPVKHRPKRTRRVKVKYGTLLCAVLIFCLFWNLIQLHWTIVKLDREIEMHLQEKQQLLAYQEELQKNLEMVKNGEYIEKLAREQLGLIKPGEKPVVTTPNSGDINN